jgi:hypothetical protein
MLVLQTGHCLVEFIIASPQALHIQRWPHGTQTESSGALRQIVHSFIALSYF